MRKKSIKNKQVESPNINMRIKPSERSLINKASKVSNKTVTDFVLGAACREAEDVLYDKRFFNLGDESYEEFVTVLDAPVPSNKELQNLLSRKPLWEQ